VNVLLQISDTHFGTEQPEVVRALLDLHRQERPRVVVLSGDITQRARGAQFAAAKAFTDQLQGSTLLSLPGNHDIPLYNLFGRLVVPYSGYSRHFGRELMPQVQTPELLVLGVNTTRRYRHVDGEVSRAQIDSVATRLAQAGREQLRVVVTHQPVHVIRESDLHNLLHGHAAAIAAWSAAGADVIMGGHIHLPYLRLLSEAHPRLPRRVWALQAGTAVSSRVRGNVPNSVNLLRHGEGQRPGCVVERWDYEKATARFQRVDSTSLDLDRATKPAAHQPAGFPAGQASPAPGYHRAP
jgi:3',5'-cyclic AMP phosphodiesterase CpdA